jgi:hypothetical protein
VALDGVRDFADSVIRVDRTGVPTALPEGISLAAAVTPATIAPQPPTETAPPLPTATPTATREPIQAATRDPATLVTSAAVTPGTAAAEPALMPVPPGDSETASPIDVEPWLLVTAGTLGIAGIGYVTLYSWGRSAANRYRDGFALPYCPVCGYDALKLRIRRAALLGIPRARHTVTCDHCGSVLRETGARRWKYRINAEFNPSLYARLNNRVVDDAALARLIAPEDGQNQSQ